MCVCVCVCVYCFCSQNGESVLHIAAQLGHCDVTTVLLEHGANPNARNQVSLNEGRWWGGGGVFEVRYMRKHHWKEHHMYLEWEREREREIYLSEH